MEGRDHVNGVERAPRRIVRNSGVNFRLCLRFAIVNCFNSHCASASLLACSMMYTTHFRRSSLLPPYTSFRGRMNTTGRPSLSGFSRMNTLPRAASALRLSNVSSSGL